MANRKGVFIGAYVPNELKESLRRRAALEHRTLSQEITRILVEAVHGKGLPVGSVDRRNGMKNGYCYVTTKMTVTGHTGFP